MASQPPPVYRRPWTPIGLGWIFAVVVVLIQILVLLHVAAFGETEVTASLLGLALALLL